MTRSKNYNAICGLVGLLVAGWLPLAAQAVVRYVPADYPTIQAALDAAADGDEIIVAPGTYPEAINFLRKAVYLHSSDGATVTTIDARGGGSVVVTCASGEGPDTILEGFTITGGAACYAGGMYNYGASPTVTNCTFSGNSAFYGGGIANYANSNPTVSKCTFSGNYVFADRGSGSGGGGMYNASSSPTVTNCTFSGNWGEAGYGGGMCNDWGSNPTVTNCTFSGNSASYGGGPGGGMCNSSSSPTVTNCTFSGNQADVGGGMDNANGSSPTVTNCTFSGNLARSGGGGMDNESSSPTLTNCVLWGDSGSEFCGDAANVTYSDVQGGYAGAGNIDANPLFIDPGHWDDNGTPEDTTDDVWVDGDYHLQSGSPCIDAGDPNFASPPGATDLDGNRRVWDGNGDGMAIVDMGAYEFGSYRYGDLNCDGAVNGFDIEPFVLALTDPAGYAAAYPLCDITNADGNADGSVNGFDIELFVALLGG